MRINRRNNRFSRMGRDLFGYRYIKRNLLIAAATVVTAAGIGLVVKYGEALDHTPAYIDSQSVQIASVDAEMMEDNSISVVMDSIQDSSAKKAAQNNTMVAKAEKKEKSEFDGKFIAQIDDTLNIRKEASTDSEIVGKLFDGNVGDVLETDGDWVKITSGDVTGYVNSSYILTGKDAEQYAEGYKKMLGTVTEDTVRVRAEKSTDSDILELVAKDTVLPVEGKDQDWVQVALENDVTGYIAADYITVAESYEYAMAIDDYTAMVDAENQKTIEVAAVEEGSSEEDTETAEIMSVEETETDSEESSEVTTEEVTTEEPTTEEPTTEAATEEVTTEAPATEEPTTEATTEEITTEAPTTEATSEETTTEAPTEEATTEASSVDPSQYDDAYLLACLVSMEAGYEPYEGQLAVANVVLNRVNSGKWGSSIASVIYAANQFPMATGSVMQGYLENGPLSTAQQAANDALAGNNNIGSFMSFLNVNYIDTDSLSDYTIIGNHCFY